MKTKIAINGFGRIGRLFFRALLENNFLENSVEVVAVNDTTDAANLLYLLKYDSVHGRLNYNLKIVDSDSISVSKYSGEEICQIKCLSQRVHPSELPWRELGAEIIIEATGAFTKSKDASGHLQSGAKKVIITAPSDSGVKTFLVGVNENSYQGEEIISNASCTTNCLAPIVYALIKENIGLEEGLFTTSHAYTASQSLVDGPSKKALRDGRAAAVNMIPASTGAAKAIQTIFPELSGKLTGMSLRVPVANVSMVDLTFKPRRATSKGEIDNILKTASETYLKNILEYTDEPVVSSDFIHSPFSAIYDSKASIELNSTFFKLIAWYDNEWGYCCRLLDLLKKVIM